MTHFLSFGSNSEGRDEKKDQSQESGKLKHLTDKNSQSRREMGYKNYDND